GIGFPRGRPTPSGVARSVPRVDADVHLRLRRSRSRRRGVAGGGAPRLHGGGTRDRAAGRWLSGAGAGVRAHGPRAARHGRRTGLPVAIGGRVPARDRALLEGRQPAEPAGGAARTRTGRTAESGLVAPRATAIDAAISTLAAAGRAAMTATYTAAVER